MHYVDRVIEVPLVAPALVLALPALTASATSVADEPAASWRVMLDARAPGWRP